MAQYKVPQDVEADDKLLGPFTFRQFVYLLIAGGLIALAVGLFQLFPVLAIIPVPPILLLLVLALPIKKDQPMETYLAALVSYYLKPRNRIWTPGQRETTIKITAPKDKVEESRTRDITGEEATHRLSFLADIVDTGGYAIKGGVVANNSSMREDLLVEANATQDMFETGHFENLSDTIAKDEIKRHEEVMKEMQEAISGAENLSQNDNEPAIRQHSFPTEADRYKPASEPVSEPDNLNNDFSPVDNLGQIVNNMPVEKDERDELENVEKEETIKAKPSIIELANNSDFSVATIAKEAKRIKERDEGEIFISLH